MDDKLDVMPGFSVPLKMSLRSSYKPIADLKMTKKCFYRCNASFLVMLVRLYYLPTVSSDGLGHFGYHLGIQCWTVV